MESFWGFLEDNSIYIVMFIVLVIWLGVFIYLNSLDKRLKNIESEIKEKSNE